MGEALVWVANQTGLRVYDTTGNIDDVQVLPVPFTNCLTPLITTMKVPGGILLPNMQ